MIWARLVILALAVGGAVPAFGFVASLTRRLGRRWRRDGMARHLVGTMAALGAIFGVSAAAFAVTMATGQPSTGTWFVVPYVGAFVWVDAMLWRRWWLLTHPRGSAIAEPGTSKDAHRS